MQKKKHQPDLLLILNLPTSINMKLTIWKSIKYLLIIGLAIFLFALFYPRTYDMPHIKPREETHFWELSTGSRIAYTLIPTKGEKSPFPIIFLQGGPGGFYSDETINRFKPLAEMGFDVYLYDQVGGGYSERLENIEEYTAERHKKDLEEIVKKIGAGKVIFIAQSWGAILATLYIADNPNRVEKVVFTGPGPIQPTNNGLSTLKPPDSLHLREPVYSNAKANKSTKNLRSEFVMRWAMLFGNKLASDVEVDDFQTLLNGKLNKSTVCDTSLSVTAEGGGGYYSQIMSIKSLANVKDPRPALKASSIPILVMKGQCDNQKWGFTNEYLQVFKNHQLVIIPNAGHSISVEQPSLYLETIADFLNK
jgi:proline iminopeptidase